MAKKYSFDLLQWITVGYHLHNHIIQWELRMQIFPVQVRNLKGKLTCFMQRNSQIGQYRIAKTEPS